MEADRYFDYKLSSIHPPMLQLPGGSLWLKPTDFVLHFCGLDGAWSVRIRERTSFSGWHCMLITESFLVSIFVLVVALVVSLGGVLALLKRKIVVDENGEVAATEIEIPLLGKIRTSAPAVAAIFIGAGMCIWTLNKQIFTASQFPLRAEIAVDGIQPRHGVFVGALPQRYLTFANNFDTNEPASIDMFVDHPDSYSVIAFAISGVREDGTAEFRVIHGPAEMSKTSDYLWFDGDLSR